MRSLLQLRPSGLRIFAAFFIALTVVASDSVADEETQAQKTYAIFKKHCHACHGAEGTIEGGLNFVLDARALVARATVKPNDLKKSLLWNRVDSGEMPPPDAATKLTATERTTIREWIVQGAKPFQDSLPSRKLITNADITAKVADDLAARDERDRKFTRYFSLVHLYNLGLSNDELTTYRNGLSKLANSLSWNPKIKVPKAINSEGTLLRIDLRDYSWTIETWQQIVDQYPYAIIGNSPTAKTVYAQAETLVPIVRGDWFVALAARPPLYHDILDLPHRDWLLERQLKVDVEANISAAKVVRAGFNGSGVSRNNRLIERHESKYGAYWKSYDFAGNTGKQNLFAHPLEQM